MNREEARQYIISNARNHLQRDRSGKGFICPVCGSGSGKKGTGITTKDGIHFTCWGKNACFMNADYIDIVGVKYGLTDYNSKLERAAEEFNITIERGHTGMESPAPEYQNQPKNERYAQPPIHNDAYINRVEEPDYTDFFLQANRDLQKTNYHRGLSLETLNRFKVGYVESWSHPKDRERKHRSPRLIIPTSRHSYLARDTRENLTPDQEQYKKQKVGKVRIFNSQSLAKAQKPIIVVEGEIDAMSIVDVGGEAVGLGSINYIDKFLELLETERPVQPLIIALDNETDPEKKKRIEAATKKLTDGLERLNIRYYRMDITGGFHDASEALNGGREAFKRTIAEAENRAASMEEEATKAGKDLLRREAVAYSLQDFIANIVASKTAAYYSTGFTSLDTILDGGLYAGLYIVGAISSLGKTTLVLQIGDQVAQQGADVLIFSLEMARNELIAKSVSRLTLTKDLAENGGIVHAKTTRGILTGSRYQSYSQTEWKLIQEAIAAYGQYGANIYITEGIGDVGIAEIREKVQKHIQITRKAPVVLIDYLQIIAPADIRATDKRNTDKAVLELKRLSRDYSIPVIGISSFNRDNYTSPVNLASFKESGAIEYSSDVLIGLQYEGMDYQEGESDGARQKRIRELIKTANDQAKRGEGQSIQVKVLKNRNGGRGEVLLSFYPMFNYFTERKEGGNNGGWSKSKGNYR